MTVEERKQRARVVSRGQHPLKHKANEIAYINPSLPGVHNLQQAFNYFAAVIYPQALDAVDTPGDLPAVGNTINDYRVVTDDGDGKAAGYRWFAFEGDTAKWHKIYDMDWGVDSVLNGFYAKTQDLYVSRLGYDDLDEDGVPLTGLLAGQRIFGGKTPSSHLTLYANSGDGTDPATGFVQFGDQVRPIIDNAFDLGTDTERWKDYYGYTADLGGLLLSAGSITDQSQLIDFADNQLQTTGPIFAANFLAEDGNQASPAFSFGSEQDTGWYLNAPGEVFLSLQNSTVAQFTPDYLNLAPGDASGPFLRFGGTAGLYGEADDLLVSTNGVERVRFISDGDVSIGSDVIYFDVDNQSLGIGTIPSYFLHVYSVDGAEGMFETRSDSENSTLYFRRTRASNANMQALDVISRIRSEGRANASFSPMTYQDVVYRGNGTTKFADFVWSNANGAAPLETMRLRYDGNLGIGATDPSHKLHVVGDSQLDNINVSVNTISTTNLNGDMVLSPNGSGSVVFAKKLLGDADGTIDLGSTATRFNALYLDNLIGDGTNSITMATLLSFRQALSGAATGMTLFYDSGTGLWTPSIPDSEIDHGTLTGLGDDDHTQYALLAGRAGGQTLIGGTGASNSLLLQSTSHGTKGNILFDDMLVPNADSVYDLGIAATNRLRNLYMVGQAIGMRLQNATTAGEPGASAGTVGRLYFNTDEKDIFVDLGGTWKKVSIEKHVSDDASTWNGSALTQSYDVSADVSDARNCLWQHLNNTDNFAQMVGAKITKTQTHVTVTYEIAPAAGTYRLVGVG